MKWTTPLILVAVLAFAGFAFRTIFLGTPETPWEVCTRLEQVTKLPSFDKRNALRSLSLGLKHPTARADSKLTGRLLRLRADIHLGMKAYDKARSDVERMQALLEEEDVGLELEAINLQARTGQTTEALRRVSVLAERHPDAPAVSTLMGRMEAKQGLEWNQQAREMADQYLVKSEAALAYPIIDHLCAQHTQDPRRTRLLRELHGFFADTKAERLGRILDLCKLSSDNYTAARNAYARGLEQEMTIPGLAALLDLLVKSGRSDLVVDLGVASRVFPEILRSPGNLLALIDAMELLGQENRIGRIVSKWPWTDAAAPRDFYVRTSQVLYNAKLYGPLYRSSRALRSFTAADLIAANFYSGVVAGSGGRYKSAMRPLNKFLKSNSRGPVPGSRSAAYRIMAAGWKEQNQPQKSLRALQGVIDSKGILVADDYLALAEAQRESSNVLPILPEENWTRGMALAPKRIAELTPKWMELGEQSFKTVGQDFERFFRSMIEQKRTQPRQKVGPYTLYRIGLQQLSERRHQSALSTANALLRMYPDLLPALELKIEALVLGKSTSHLGPATLLQRLRLVGADAKSQAYLTNFRLGRFSKDEQLELIRLDPFGVGRSQIAHWLYEQGLTERVLLVLRPIAGHEDPPALKALRFQALFSTQRYDQLIEETEPWLTHPAIGQLCQRLNIRAHLLEGRRPQALQGLRTLLAKGPRDPKARQKLAEDLIQQGLLEAAHPILMRYDARSGLRTPSVIEWNALCASAAGQTDKAQDYLTRALPFFDNGRIELLQVILSAGERDWPALPLHIQRLDESDFIPTPFQSAAIALLGERLQAGLEMIRIGVQREPASMSWALLDAAAQTLNKTRPELSEMFGPQAAEQARPTLTGSGDERRDPRDTVALLLALDIAPWQSWTATRALASGPSATQNLWLGWLIAESQFRSGQLEQARSSYSELIARFPACAPLWDHQFQVLNALHPEDPLHAEMLAARADQVLAIPIRKFLSPGQVTLGLAAQASIQGQPEQAVHTLERYLQGTDAEWKPEAHWMLGRLLAAQGQFGPALDQFEEVLLGAHSKDLHPWATEYLDWAKRSTEGSGASLTAAQLVERLETLSHRYPSDPDITLTRLMFRVKADERSVLLASDEALASLEMLRSLAPNQSLDALRPGANRAWMRYLMSVSPVLGEEYCRAQLDSTPGNLDMWIGLSHALHTQGQILETHDLVADLLKISDDPELHYRLASLLALRGESSKEIQAHLTYGDQLAGVKGKSPRNSFIQAQTTLLHGIGGLDKVVSDLAKLWPNRDSFSGDVPPLELGRVYLTALVLRHKDQDLRSLERVSEEMLQYVDQDPYAFELIHSFRAVGNSLGARLLAKIEDE